jgi:hypothetical protein
MYAHKWMMMYKRLNKRRLKREADGLIRANQRIEKQHANDKNKWNLCISIVIRYMAARVGAIAIYTRGRRQMESSKKRRSRETKDKRKNPKRIRGRCYSNLICL